MAFLYRRDLQLLGYEIRLNEVKKRRVLSVVANADILTGNITIPCVATFFKYRKGVRVDYIFDEDLEKIIMDHYMLFIRKSPRLLIELLARFIVKAVAYASEIVALGFIGHTLSTNLCVIPLYALCKILGMLICVVMARCVIYYCSLL